MIPDPFPLRASRECDISVADVRAAIAAVKKEMFPPLTLEDIQAEFDRVNAGIPCSADKSDVVSNKCGPGLAADTVLGGSVVVGGASALLHAKPYPMNSMFDDKLASERRIKECMDRVLAADKVANDKEVAWKEKIENTLERFGDRVAERLNRLEADISTQPPGDVAFRSVCRIPVLRRHTSSEERAMLEEVASAIEERLRDDKHAADAAVCEALSHLGEQLMKRAAPPLVGVAWGAPNAAAENANDQAKKVKAMAEEDQEIQRRVDELRKPDGIDQVTANTEELKQASNRPRKCCNKERGEERHKQRQEIGGDYVIGQLREAIADARRQNSERFMNADKLDGIDQIKALTHKLRQSAEEIALDHMYPMRIFTSACNIEKRVDSWRAGLTKIKARPDAETLQFSKQPGDELRTGAINKQVDQLKMHMAPRLDFSPGAPPAYVSGEHRNPGVARWEKLKSDRSDVETLTFSQCLNAELGKHPSAKNLYDTGEVNPAALPLGLQPALKQQVGGNHYKDLVIQPVEYCQRNGLGFCESSVVKYVSRYKAKNGVEDLRKARHFLDLLIEMTEGQTKKATYCNHAQIGYDA